MADGKKLGYVQWCQQNTGVYGRRRQTGRRTDILHRAVKTLQAIHLQAKHVYDKSTKHSYNFKQITEQHAKSGLGYCSPGYDPTRIITRNSAVAAERSRDVSCH